MIRALLGLCLALVLTSCGKVRLVPVAAGFSEADAVWFEDEQTLFFFYEVNAEQGLRQLSQVEIRYTTDDEIVDWTPITDLTTVHTHLAVDCGVNARCGSSSVHVVQEPRDVGMRLRYHPEGELALDAEVVYNVVGRGAPHSNRSFVIYGVFDESNTLVQWRGRHQFPTVRNGRAQRLGLRRDFTVREQQFGQVAVPPQSNPYGYGIACPTGLTKTSLPDLTTNERAIFNGDPLPVEAGAATAVCAEVSVRDGTGSFTTDAYAKKNPEIRSAFPELRSPIREATVIPYFLGPCTRTISDEHEEMQRQRLQMEGVETYCTEGADSPGFRFQLAVDFLERIEAERPKGNDMVLVVGVHRDESAVGAAVEQALSDVLPRERHKSTPRVVGGFVFDSQSRTLSRPGVEQTTLWCPATVTTNSFNESVRSCPLLPDDFGVIFGPIEIDTLPILPPRDDYLEFLRDFSERQAGTVTNLRYLAPEFPTTSVHRDLLDFGVVTFLNGETITADADDAFSYCQSEDAQPFLVQSDLMQNPQLAYLLADYCFGGPTGPTDSGYFEFGIPPTDIPTTGYEYGSSICDAIALKMIRIDALPDWHSLFSETEYELGVFWEFPFLLKMDYESSLAVSVSAFGVSVPFGFKSPNQTLYGAELWEQSTFRIDPTLTHCRRFCDHPTFDGAGVYNIRAPFRTTYARACYAPRFPDPDDKNEDNLGFPLDP